ncbi:MAG: TRIC cation channel family protein [Aldersonia sp.]|nr:TRIC cation channel family protein [Aldersonia sp.]
MAASSATDHRGHAAGSLHERELPGDSAARRGGDLLRPSLGSAVPLRGARLRRRRLGLFCVTGTLKALDFHLGSVQAALLGITTAVGGGVLRDITARETPALVQVDTDLYSIPAAAGAVVVAGAYQANLPMPIVASCAAVLVFLFRIVAMLRHWTAPHARAGQARNNADG